MSEQREDCGGDCGACRRCESFGAECEEQRQTAAAQDEQLRERYQACFDAMAGIPDPEAFVRVADSLAKMVDEDFAEIGSPLDASVNVYRAARGTPRPSSDTEGGT